MIYDRFLNCGRKKIETIENNLLTLPFSCMKLELFSLMKKLEDEIPAAKM